MPFGATKKLSKLPNDSIGLPRLFSHRYLQKYCNFLQISGCTLELCTLES